MKTLIFVAGHKIIKGKIVVHLFYDEIEWDNIEEKTNEAQIHVDWMKSEYIEKYGYEFHSESITFIDQEK